MAPKVDKKLFDNIGMIPPGSPESKTEPPYIPSGVKPPASPVVKPPASKPEPPDNLKVISEVKDLLTQAMDKLSSIGGASEMAGPNISPRAAGPRPPLEIKGGGY